MSVHIEVYHDLICPWCRIGKRNLETALNGWDGPTPAVSYRPFLLNPDATEQPMPIAEYFRTMKGISDIRPIIDRVVSAGAEVGLRFDYDRVVIVPTHLAHRLILMTHEQDQPRLIDAMHTAHFEQGQNIADTTVLRWVLSGLGIDPIRLIGALESGGGMVDLQGQLREAQATVQGGVPFFVFNQRFALSGAQPATVLAEAIARANEDRVEC